MKSLVLVCLLLMPLLGGVAARLGQALPQSTRPVATDEFVRVKDRGNLGQGVITLYLRVNQEAKLADVIIIAERGAAIELKGIVQHERNKIVVKSPKWAIHPGSAVLVSNVPIEDAQPQEDDGSGSMGAEVVELTFQKQ